MKIQRCPCCDVAGLMCARLIINFPAEYSQFDQPLCQRCTALVWAVVFDIPDMTREKMCEIAGVDFESARRLVQSKKERQCVSDED